MAKVTAEDRYTRDLICSSLFEVNSLPHTIHDFVYIQNSVDIGYL